MHKTHAIILSEECSTAEIIKLYLEESGIFDIDHYSSSYSDIFNKVCSVEDNFLIIADLSIGKQEKLDLILRITNTCKNCKVLALSDIPSVDLIVEIMRSGAKEFVTVPILKKEFMETVNKLKTSDNFQEQKTKCKIISVFSNKDGNGKTSLAANLALELSKITKENVALLDLNFQSGDITTFLDLKPSFNISYMLENPDKINEIFLLSTLERYKQTSLYILADPPYFKQADNINPSQIAKLFNKLKDTFSYIIVDADSSFGAKSISALDNSDIILLVTVANLPALRNTQRCLDLFDKLGYDKEKVKIILNRYMENDEIKEDDVVKVLSKEIYRKIPNNYFALMSAINKGIPVSEINPGSNIAQSYKDIAQNIVDNTYKMEMTERFENIFSKG